MKLQRIQRVNDYLFRLIFENGTDVSVNLYDLIHDKVPPEALQSANINRD